MDQIFRRAIRCIVWLGEALLPDHQTIVIDEHWFYEMNTSEKKQRLLEVLQHLYEQSEARWWERLWIVQEVVLAQRVEVYFGEFMMSWDDFCESIFGVWSWRQYLSVGPFPKTKSFQQLMKDRLSNLNGLRINNREKDDGDSLSSVIETTNQSLCSDSRDKIYAILSLLGSRERSLIQPDYTISEADTFTAATYASIVGNGSLAILEMIDLRDRRRDLPSWVADFNSTAFVHPGLYEAAAVLLPLRPGAGGAELQVVVQNSAQDDTIPRVINIKGYLYADIKQTLDLAETTMLPQKLMDLLSAAASFKTVPGGALEPEGLQCILVKSKEHPFELAYDQHKLTQLPAWKKVLHASSKGIDEHVILASFKCWGEITGVGELTYGGLTISTRDLMSREVVVRRACEYAIVAASGMSFFVTSSGHIGLAPVTIKLDDHIVLIEGQRPLILRREGTGYTFRGFAHVHGIMYGELRDHEHNFDLKEQEFCIY